MFTVMEFCSEGTHHSIYTVLVSSDTIQTQEADRKSRLHTVLQTSVLVKRTVKRVVYLFCVSVLETGCPYATQVGLEFIILLPRSPDCRDLRHALLA